jgi:2'-5' RNA ligase
VTLSQRRSALVVVANDAEPVVRACRDRHHRVSVERGIPEHLTILFPFLSADDLDGETLGTLRRVFAPVLPFAYELARVESFPDAVWLAPEPAEPFLDLIAQARDAYPELAPYGDPSLEPVPHCTIAAVDNPAYVDELVRELRAELEPRLPIRCRATSLALLAEQPDETWRTHATIPLEGRP